MQQTSFEKIFKQHSPKYAFLLPRMREAIGVKEVTFDDINSTNIGLFKEYMSDDVTTNSLKTYMAVISSVVNQLADDGLVRRINLKVVSRVKATPSENIALTEEEIKRIEQYYDRLLTQPKHQVEKDVLTIFLMECVTGARNSDCYNITEENIRDGKLVYVSKKTKQKSVMPVHPRLRLYLANKPKKEYERKTASRILKQTAERCGINEKVSLFYHGKLVNKPKSFFVSTHTGRRSFATILAKKGVPITEICQFMNHKNNINMTMRYIVADADSVSPEAMSFFNG